MIRKIRLSFEGKRIFTYCKANFCCIINVEEVAKGKVRWHQNILKTN